MKATKILLAMIVLLGVASIASAGHDEAGLPLNGVEEKELGVTFDLTYMSKYMSWGAEGYGEQGGLFAHMIFDFWGSGFGLSVGHQNSTNNGLVDSQRMNYNVFYKGVAFEDSPYKTKYKANWRYEHYYGKARNKSNAQEWTFSFSWPEILGVENLSPYYIFDYEHAAGSNYGNRKRADYVHVFGLAYNLKTEELDSPIKLTADVTYCDGFYTDGGGNEIHDWSHVTLGASTKFKLSDNLSFVPGVYHQITMDKGVCDENVTYTKLCLQYKF